MWYVCFVSVGICVSICGTARWGDQSRHVLWKNVGEGKEGNIKTRFLTACFCVQGG